MTDRNTTLPDPAKIEELRDLDAAARRLRDALGFATPGEVLYHADLSVCDDEIFVVADGYGGATVEQVRGNFPVDYFTKHESFFESAERATSFANFVVGEEESEEGEYEGFASNDNGDVIWPERVEEKPTVECKFCHEQVPASTAHRHTDGYVGDACCWDERLRSSE